jgi:hypothetical protein
MTLLSITIPKKEVTLGDGQKFTVKGISANDIFGIYHRHAATLGQVFNIVSGRGELDATELVQVANSIEGLILRFPLLAAEGIAIAAGVNPFDETPHPEDPSKTIWQATVNMVIDLPLAVQADALMKIGELTFSPDMPPKKFFGLLVMLIQQAQSSHLTLDSGSDD